jgi:succinoglycan biosynthesis transport protein ExoP
MTLEEMLYALLRRWKLIALGAVFTGLVALGVSFVVPPTYEAVSTVAIAKSTVAVNFDEKLRTLTEEELLVLFRREQDLKERRKALEGLVQNAAIAQKVLEQLGDQLPDRLRQPGELIKIVEGKLVGDSIEIRVRADNPTVAAAIANAWGREYEKHINSIYATTVQGEALPDVQREAARAWSEYLKAQEELQKFIAENNIDKINRLIEEKKAILTSLSEGQRQAKVAVLQQQTEDRTAKLANTYAQRRLLEQLLENAQAFRAQIKTDSPQATAVTNGLPILLLKIQAFASAGNLPSKLELSLLGAEGLAAEPQKQIEDLDALISSLQQQIEELNTSIKEQSTALLRNAGYDFLDTEPTQDDSLSQAIDKLDKEIKALQAQLESEQARRKELVRARDLAWEKYNTLANKVAEVDVASAITGTEVRFAKPAFVPKEPVSPKKAQNALLGLFAGLVLAMGFVLLKEHPLFNGGQTRAVEEKSNENLTTHVQG